MKINRYRIFICLCIATTGFLLGFYLPIPLADKKYTFYTHPYRDYGDVAGWGDTVKYNQIVYNRMINTPSHPDYLDLSVIMATKFKYTPAYYNAYLAINNLYKYNHFCMGVHVKRLMYSYLQLAIDHHDKRVSDDELREYHTEYPDGIVLY